MLALVADSGRLEIVGLKPSEAEPAQDPVMVERLSPSCRGGGRVAGQPLAPEPFDGGDRPGRGRMGRASGRLAPVAESALVPLPEPPQQLQSTPLRQIGRRDRIRPAPAFVDDPPDHEGSTLRRRTPVLVNVHPVCDGACLCGAPVRLVG